MPILPSLLRLFDGRARCELGFTAPFALLAGGLYGYQLGGGALVILACAVLLAGFVAMQVALEPTVVARFGGAGGQWGPAVAFAWDTVTGTVVGFPVVWLLQLPAGPAVGAAASCGAVYGWVMGYVVCGGAPEVVVRVLTQGGGGLRRSDHSFAQSLEARGEIQAAANQYELAMRDEPRDPAPYLALARLQAGPLGHPGDAVITLRSALANAKLEANQETLTLRHIVEIFEGIGRPFGGAPDLARYLHHSPTGPAAAWAEGALADMKRRMAEDRGRAVDGPRHEEG